MLDSLFNKAAGPQTLNFFKKGLQHKCFPSNFAKFLRTPILKKICERLLLVKITVSDRKQNGLTTDSTELHGVHFSCYKKLGNEKNRSRTDLFMEFYIRDDQRWKKNLPIEERSWHLRHFVKLVYLASLTIFEDFIMKRAEKHTI